MTVDTHTHTHTHGIHNNNMVDSTMCSFRAVFMSSRQSIISLMGIWSATLMTLCWCSVIRVKCNTVSCEDQCSSFVVRACSFLQTRSDTEHVFFQTINCRDWNWRELWHDFQEKVIYFYWVIDTEAVSVPQGEKGDINRHNVLKLLANSVVRCSRSGQRLLFLLRSVDVINSLFPAMVFVPLGVLGKIVKSLS